MARIVSIGEQDFGELLREDSFYIDKTYFIKEWWENRDKVTLIARPRRFGKTLTMSMLDHFFSIRHAGSGDLFEGLSVWEDEKYRKLQGTHPVIFLSFASIKADCYEESCYGIRTLISREYRRHAYLLDSSDFLQADRKRFEKILLEEANVSEVSASINLLSEYLYNYYGKKVIILLDEYDTPMQEAYVYGYWKELIEFMRRFMNPTFKTNPYLERGLMTGITRLSNESIFSDLNNLEVVMTTSNKYETAFGFTEEEVFAALEEFGLEEQRQRVRRWYDGFRFGNCSSIYNPWSIVNYLKSKEFKPYWANTSSNKLAADLIQKGSPDIKMTMEDLLWGNSFCTYMDEEVVFNQLDSDENAVWSLLLAAGYLKAVEIIKSTDDYDIDQYRLTLTNAEVRQMLARMIHGWFSDGKTAYNSFEKALLSDDVKGMNVFMNKIALNTFSCFDTGKKPSETAEPERFYHGFVLGLIVNLKKKYEITSNRESGFGRYDIMLAPAEGRTDGMILEFKVLDPDEESSLQDTAEAALRQIINKEYAAALEAKGVARTKIKIYGFAFSGKQVQIDGGCIVNYDQRI